jgi:hypothetical protein
MRIRLAVILFLLSACRVAYCDEENEDGWQFELTPYVWLPTISGKLNYEAPPAGPGGGLVVDVGPTDWLDLINGVVFLSGGMRKGRFSLGADLVFLSMVSDNDKVIGTGTGGDIPIDASLNVSTQTDLDGLTWTLVAGYTLTETDRSAVDIIGGVRLLEVDVATSWNLALDITVPGGEIVLPSQGSTRVKQELWDGIVGVRGHSALGEGAWSVNYYLDVGTGSSELTWQAVAGLAYAYSWGDLMLMYRHLHYDEDSSGLMQDFILSGPTFGARFRF